MIVLDKNLVSEVLRANPEGGVVAWMESLTGEVAITAITLAELLAGVRRLSDGRRKYLLVSVIERAVDPYRGSRAILAFDEAAAEHHAAVLRAREDAGLPISTAAAGIAAICLAHAATCATRNSKDFVHTGVEVLNPWDVAAR
jgi:toxin FitB